jgi:hypothetical protein
LAENWAERTVD